MINMMETKCQLITKANQIMTNMVYVEYRDEIKIIKSEHISFNSRRCGQFLGPKGTRRRKTWHIRNKKKNELSPYMMN